MSVVLRCPICGTTQGRVGECEACSEGKVRYYCTNHEEGIWLDSPVCSRCGARFGDAARASPAPRTPAGPPRPAGAADFRAPGRRPPERPPEPEFGRRPPERPEVEELAEPDVVPRAPTLGELLGEITGERVRTRGRYEAEEVPWTAPGAHRPVLPLAGCLVRMVGLVFLLIAAVIIFLLLLFGGYIIN